MSEAPRVSVLLFLNGGEVRAMRTLESLTGQSAGFGEAAELVVGHDGSSAMRRAAKAAQEQLGAVVVESVFGTAESAWEGLLERASGSHALCMTCGEELARNTLAALRDSAAEHPERRCFGLQRFFVRSQRIERERVLPQRSESIDLRAVPAAVAVSLRGACVRIDALRAAAAAVPRGFELEGLRLCLALQREQGWRLEYVNPPESGFRFRGTKVEAWSRDEANTALDACARLRSEDPEETAILDTAAVYLLYRLTSGYGEGWFDDAVDADRFAAQVIRCAESIPAEAVAGAPWWPRPAEQYFVVSGFMRAQPWRREGGDLRYRGATVLPVSALPIDVMRVNAGRDAVELQAIYPDFALDGFDLALRSERGELVRALEADRGESGPAPMVCGEFASPTQYRRFEVPVTAVETGWRFVWLVDGDADPHPATDVRQHRKNPFARPEQHRRLIVDGCTVAYEEQRGFVITGREASWMRYTLRRMLQQLRRSRRVPWSLLFAKRDKRYILINDRPEYGGDNGEALFRYVQEQRPEWRDRTWFVLGKDAVAYEELAKTGRVIEPYSLKHRIVYLNTRLHFSSHVPLQYNSPWRGDEDPYLSDFIDPTFIWLRHGVTMNSVDKTYNRFDANIDGMVATAGYEVDYLERPGSFYSDETVLASGLPRFDLLRDTSREQPRRAVLYLPTWRKWLAGPIQPGGSRGAVPGFAESDYYRMHRAMLADEEIAAALREANAYFEFLLHPVMGVYRPEYEGLASDTVVVRDLQSTKYSDLFARGAAMITDYSSVFVDFSYLGKPVLFDQSDVDRFRGRHYKRGLFDYETQAPGPVLTGFDELKRATLELIRSDFAADPAYAGRLDGLFLHRDHSNSERVLELGLALDERRRRRAA